ncbi:MAG TPA: AarF/UbiB family protein, partial [Thermoanaerobaculia bacterium]
MIQRRRHRLLKVYGTLARVLASYAGLRLAGFFRGSAWNERALSRRNRANARRVRETILDVQGLFIKVGQLISILTNFLPADFRGELEGVQDQIPPRPLAEIAQRLRSELGGGPEELFADFEAEPVAAASLAQVHAARLHDGRRVAVKVQHVDVEELATADLATIRRILRIVQWVLGIRGLTTAFAEIREMILDELDFAREGEHIEAIAANFVDDPMVSFPQVIHERTTRRVLTTH